MKKEIRKNTIATMITDETKQKIIEQSTKENKSTSQFINDVLVRYFEALEHNKTDN